MSVEHLIIIRNRTGIVYAGPKRPLDTTRRPNLLARRLGKGGKQWRFYDLGTRLQTVVTGTTYAAAGRPGTDNSVPVLNGTQTLEYVELALDAAGQFTDIKAALDVPEGETDYYAFTSRHVQVAAENPGIITDWDQQMLGIGKTLNPLAFSQYPSHPAGGLGLNGDGTIDAPRKIPNCMPLWYGPNNQPGLSTSTVIRLTVSPGTYFGYFTLYLQLTNKIGTSKEIAYNAPPYKIKQALEQMTWQKDPMAIGLIPNYKPIDVGDIASVSGSLATGLDIRFGGKLATYKIPAFTADTSTLQGGTLSIAVIQNGVVEIDMASPNPPISNRPTTPDAVEISYSQSSGYNDNIFDIEVYKNNYAETYPNTRFREIVEDVARWWRFSAFDPEFLQQTFLEMQTVLNIYWLGEDARQNGETWNSLNLIQNGSDITQKGIMQSGDSGKAINVKLTSRLAYEPFDTGDLVNFKITSTSNYNGDVVPFNLAHNAEARFYLRPQLHGFARQLDYRRSENINISSYRYYNPSLLLWYNNQTSQDAYAPPTGNVYAQLNIGSSMDVGIGQDPNSGPFTFTVTGTINRTTGAYSFSGLHDGSTVTGTATYIPAVTPGFPGDWEAVYRGPNYGVTIFADEYRGIEGDTNLLTMTVSTAPQYVTSGHVINVNAGVWRGVHIGRYPIFPINVSSGGWQSQTSSLETQTQTFADGTTQTKTFADSVQMPGRELVMNFGSTVTARQVYSRRSNRDAKDYVYYRPITYFDVQAETGQNTDRLIATDQIEWRKLTPVASTQNAITTEATAAAQDLKNQILAYNHVATIATTGTSVSFGEPSFNKKWIMLPIDAPAGTLCAVIVSGKKQYYVWRKTTETRNGYDHERNQAVCVYSGNIT